VEVAAGRLGWGMARAVWQEDESASVCKRCRAEFTLMTSRHHCRRCGQIFCAACSEARLIIPLDLLVVRPASYLEKKGLMSSEQEFRSPQRVCDPCSHGLRGIQGELRALVSQCNLEAKPTMDRKAPNVPQLDFFLENEIKNATRVLHHLRTAAGEEKIPQELLHIAKGIAFLTVAKAGFIFTGRYGTGFVISKKSGNMWSAPSAVAMSGLGWGLQMGAELTDVILVLTSDSAVETFKSRGQVTVGAEIAVSVGPVGRSIESDVTAGNKGAAHAFSYAQSRGLFVGASLEACGFIQRKDVNSRYYGEQVGASALLTEYPIPRGAEPLYKELDLVLFNGRVQPDRERLRLTQYASCARSGGAGSLLPASPPSLVAFRDPEPHVAQQHGSAFGSVDEEEFGLPSV